LRHFPNALMEIQVMPKEGCEISLGHGLLHFIEVALELSGMLGG
jgi:hypothetical protein